MTTKRQIIDDAYSAAGLASFAFDLSAEEIEAARRALDSMVAQWNMRGVRLGYSMTDNVDAESGLPDWAIEAVSLNLSLRLAGRVGKAVMPETKAAAKQAYNSMMGVLAVPPKMKLDTMIVPAGAGNRPSWYRGDIYLDAEKEQIETGRDGLLDLGS